MTVRHKTNAMYVGCGYIGTKRVKCRPLSGVSIRRSEKGLNEIPYKQHSLYIYTSPEHTANSRKALFMRFALNAINALPALAVLGSLCGIA